MAAPDFYFCINATARHIRDHYGKDGLVAYWRSLAREYYRRRIDVWRAGGLQAVADDWRTYFAKEPNASVDVTVKDDAVELDVKVCPAIKHLREHSRDIVLYFCEHCDQMCGEMAEFAGFIFRREGFDGACRQWFIRDDRCEMERVGC